MPIFTYYAKDRDAKPIRDSEEAPSKAELIARLKSRGLFIVSIREGKSGGSLGKLHDLFSKESGKRSSIKLYDLAMLARNLSIILSSGVTLLRSLEVLASQTQSQKLERILVKCSNNIKAGLSLSEAFGKYPKVFSALWRGILEVGEASGNLPFVLGELADYLEMRMEFERRIKSSLVYPAILLVASISAIIVFLKLILPKFAALFSQFDITLPTATKVVFSIGGFFEKNLFLMILIIIGGVVVFLALRKQPEFERRWDKISLQLPLFGRYSKLLFLERFTSTMSILLESGLTLVYTLEVSARSVGNSHFERQVLLVRQRVRDGAPLSLEMQKLDVFPLLVSEMAKIGEETGSLPEVFKKISDYYQKELITNIERFVAAIEPLMILIMGAIIGGMVIALFLPMFQLTTLGTGI